MRMSSEERRSQILDAAASVFVRRGGRNATTREIAAEAGVSEAILYRHFAGKEDLFFQVLEKIIDDTMAIMDDYRDLPEQDFLSGLGQVHMVRVKENFPMVSFLLSQVLSDDEIRRFFMEKIVSPTGAKFMERLPGEIRGRSGDARDIPFFLAPVVFFEFVEALNGKYPFGYTREKIISKALAAYKGALQEGVYDEE